MSAIDALRNSASRADLGDELMAEADTKEMREKVREGLDDATNAAARGGL
jgi:hypothetical protein